MYIIINLNCINTLIIEHVLYIVEYKNNNNNNNNNNRTLTIICTYIIIKLLCTIYL